jgi:uridine kinase
MRIFVSIDLDESVRRGVDRDADLVGSRADAERRYRTRYAAGQRLYLAESRPVETPERVVVDDDPAGPRLLVRC